MITARAIALLLLFAVTAGAQANQPPVLNPIGPKSTTENVFLTFNVSATDAESTPELSTSTLPDGASFTDNGDGTGHFDWTPSYLQSGLHSVTFYATDDSAEVDYEVVSITVIEAGNQPPVLDPIGNRSTTEGQQLTFTVTASDAESTPSLSTGTLWFGGHFTDNGDGTGVFDWTPGYTQSGVYVLRFFATDDSAAVDTELVQFTVYEAGNQQPVLAPIGPQSVTEGSSLSVAVSASDPESTPDLTTSALPSGAFFTDYGNGTGDLDWTPDNFQSGVYSVTFYATDDSSAVDSETVSITVYDSGNQLPVLASIGPRSTTENVPLSFIVTATDAESVPGLSTSTLPSGSSFNDNGDGSGSFSWTPDFLQSGQYSVTFYATDDSSAVDSEEVIITVNEAGNQLPILAPIGPRSTSDNVLLSFPVAASDIESTPSLSTSTLPTGAAFTDHGNGSGSFSWTPGYAQTGVYVVTFYATDDSGAVDSEPVTITVNEVGNQPPVLAAIGAQATGENVLLTFGVSATDPESIPALTTSALPAGAVLTDYGDGTADFNWTPTYQQSGAYSVTFYATDDSSVVDSEIVAITVTDAGNQLPVLAGIGAQQTVENSQLLISISATDPESVPALTTSTLPTGAAFTDNGNGTAVFDWTPTYLQSGTYPVTFYATDDSAAVDSEEVTITVTDAGNQLPLLAAIGAQSTTENVQLTFGVSATDIESTPALTTSALPSGASFTDNHDGTGSFDWTPDFLQSGDHIVMFYATDDSSAVDSEEVTITVIEAGNQLPILASIGAQSTDENVPLSFGVSAGDIESTPDLTTSTLPEGATFVDHGDGTGSFDWTPTYLQSGSYPVTFYATDDSSAVDSEEVIITVNEAGNQLPVLASIGGQSTDENVLMTFGISASDAESVPALTTSTLPDGAIFTDHGDGTADFDWTPTYVQSGSYPVTFYATDDSSAVDSEEVVITVNEVGNQLPVLASIGAQSTDELVQLTFGVSATDQESVPTLTTSTLPTGAVFTNNGDGTGSFDWTPDYTQAGSYPVTFYATDDSLAVDSEEVTITVANINQPPVLAPIGPQSVLEGNALNIPVSASDLDGTFATLTTSSLPSGATFVDHGDGTGDFDWSPTYVQSGSYPVTFYATDDSSVVDSEAVTITVNEAGNQPPVLSSIGPQSTDENVPMTFGVSASDAESVPALTTSTLPSGASFTDHGDGTGDFDWTPTYLQSGNYPVTLYATDDSSVVDSEIVTLTVVEAGNQLPVLAPIGPQAGEETHPLNIAVSAGDVESTPALTTSTLPTGATFVDHGDGTGDFDWTPDTTQAGDHIVVFYATDDSSAVDSESVTISIAQKSNEPPILASIGDQSTTENVPLSFAVSATDVESTPALTTTTLPSGATFTDHGDGTGSFDWMPTFLQAGNYPVTFYATDDSSAVDSEAITITVLEAGNQPPVLASIGDQSTTENVNLSFPLSATDAESTPALSISSLPDGALLTDNGDGTGSFDWTPDYTQSGVWVLTFYATDDSSAVDSEAVTITVAEVGNQWPVLSTIGPQSTDEGVTLAFGVTASDAESVPDLTTSTLPSGAIFTDNGDGTGDFDWTPTYLQSGSYSVTFYATDDSLEVDSESVAITVVEAGNQPPVLAPIGPQTAQESEPFSLGVSATDAESTPSLTTSTLPSGASFTDYGDGSGSFDWLPDSSQIGGYFVTFYATDDSLAVDSETVVIEVTNVNRPPVLAAIGPQTTGEGVALSVPVSATDPDGEIPSLTAGSLPSGATFTDFGNGSGSFDWTPDYVQSGDHDVTFYAVDDSLATDSEIVTITVTDAGNQPPVLDPIGNKSTSELANLLFRISASDPEGVPPSFTTLNLPSGATFVDSGNGAASFDWTPQLGEAGDYTVIFYAIDDSGAVDPENVTITVGEVGNLPPDLDPIGPREVSQLSLLSFIVTATDINGTTPVLTADPLPSGATFNDHDDGSATFIWTPSATQGGVYLITFYATDDWNASDSEVVAVTVTDNAPPVITLNSPPNDSLSTVAQMDLDMTVYDASPTTVWIYGGTNWQNLDLISVMDSVVDPDIIYPWSALPLDVDSTGTIGLWHFDENTGILLGDESGYTNDGQLLGDASWTQNGRFGFGVSYDGAGDYVAVPDAPSLDVDRNTGVLTIEAWVYPAAGGGFIRSLVSKRRLAGPARVVNYELAIFNNRLAFIGGDESTVYLTSHTVPVETWTYVAVTLDAATDRARFYINGTQVQAINNVAFGPTHDDPLYIGSSGPSGDFFKGVIDEVKLSDHIVDSATIAANYRLGSGVYYWTVTATDTLSMTTDSDVRTFTIDFSPYTNCCDVAGDYTGDGAFDISDLVAVVDYMFTSGAPPACFNDLDVDGSCVVDISDLVAIVDYMFNSGDDLVCGCVE